MNSAGPQRRKSKPSQGTGGTKRPASAIGGQQEVNLQDFFGQQSIDVTVAQANDERLS
jgi:hypothetical protein